MDPWTHETLDPQTRHPIAVQYHPRPVAVQVLGSCVSQSSAWFCGPGKKVCDIIMQHQSIGLPTEPQSDPAACATPLGAPSHHHQPPGGTWADSTAPSAQYNVAPGQHGSEAGVPYYRPHVERLP